MKKNEVVERLAKKWDDAYAGQEYPEDDPERHEVACADAGWWLNAIADELGQRGGNLKTGDLNPYEMARWLQEQAKDST